MDIYDRRILVTGGKGFLGSYLIPKLEKKGAKVFSFNSKEYDLTKENDISRLFEKIKPEIVIHLAARFGNQEYLKGNESDIFYDNLLMNSFVLEYSRRYHVAKFVGIGTAFAYSEYSQIPFKEKSLLEGKIETLGSCYGLSKKILLSQSQIYQASGFPAIHLVLTSLYGPGAKDSSAIMSIIRKINDAKKNGKPFVELWGTGNATRDFLYADDAADAIILAVENYEGSEPINIGSGRETSISNLVKIISKILDFQGEILWDVTKPEGMKRILLDNSKAKREFGFEAKISLEEGLKKTIKFFLQ